MFPVGRGSESSDMDNSIIDSLESESTFVGLFQLDGKFPVLTIFLEVPTNKSTNPCPNEELFGDLGDCGSGVSI